MSCITEILKLKNDQDALVPEGNWIAVEGGGTYKEYEYLVVLNDNGYRCGYVALPPTHKYSDTPMEMRDFMGSGKKLKHWDYDQLDIDCHGGLTFMSSEHGLKKLLPVACNDIWIGFDCGHCQDMCDVEAFRKYYGEEDYKKKKLFFHIMNHGLEAQTIKQFGYVEKECQNIIEQLIKEA